MARRRNQIPSISETNLYFANNMLIAFCVQPPAIFLHSGGKFPAAHYNYYLYTGLIFRLTTQKKCIQSAYFNFFNNLFSKRAHFRRASDCHIFT